MARAHKMRKITATKSISKNVRFAKSEMDVNKWSDLPRDALSKIFSFFNPIDIILVIPFVCKYWGRIFFEHLFCKGYNNHLDFGPLGKEPFRSSFYKMGDDNASAVKLMNLLVAVMHAFSLDAPSDADDNSLRVTPITQISFPPDLPVYDRHIVYLAERCPELENLFLPCAKNITGRGISKATMYWSQMKMMFYGPFTWRNQPVTDRHFTRTVQEFGINCKNLVRLALLGFHFHWESAALIAQNLKSLVILQLLYATISKHGLQIFLSKSKNLDELCILECATTNGEGINHAEEFKIFGHQEGRRIKWSTDLYADKADECYTAKEVVNIIWKPVEKRFVGAEGYIQT